MKISSEFELNGPFKIIKKTKEVREVKNQNILSVTFYSIFLLCILG